MISVTAATFALVMLPASPMAEAGDRPCRLWVRGEAFYDVEDKDGNPRSNPDETLYPGDAFRYVFTYGFSRYCFSQQVLPVESFDAIKANHTAPAGTADVLVKEARDCFGHTGGEGGWFFWDTRDDCGYLKLTIKAKERHCNAHHCYTITRTASDTIVPALMAPVVEVNLWEEVIRDRDGYNATNRDMTNYVWDPIAIRHESEFVYKDEREGTIRFDYTRTFDPLVDEGGYECDWRCSRSLSERDPASTVGTGFTPYPSVSRNGGGMYAYAAPSLSQIGYNNIHYHVAVINEGQQINTHFNSTDQLVVAYDPVYEHYDYTVFDDGQRYAYGDRQGLLMHYFGSLGSGRDDNGLLNDERRSKINAFYPETKMHSEFGFPPIAIDGDMLRWNSTGHINGTDPVPWLSLDVGHAVFSEEGYGILRFAQNITDIVFAEEKVYRFYFNTTTFNSIASDYWGGYDSYRNFNYTYQYPHAPIRQMYTLEALDMAENRDDTVVLQVTATPAEITHGRTDDLSDNTQNVRIMLDDYLHAKALFDTGDGHFANGTVQETHSMTNNATGTGVVSMPMNRTALQFVAGYPYDRDGILERSRYLALELDAPIHVVEQLADGSMQVERRGLYEFSFDHHDRFVVDRTWQMNVSRPDNGTAVFFAVPEHFGEVKSITVGGREYSYLDVCNEGCLVHAEDTEQITVRNYWGSTLTGTAPAAHVTIPADPESTFAATYGFVFAVAAIAVVAFLSYLFVRKTWPERA